MERRIKVIYLLIFTMLVSFIPGEISLAARPIKLIVDGKDITSLSMPVIENDRTLVPIRFIAEELGAEVSWDEVNRIVGIKKGNNKVLLKIDSRLVTYESGTKSYNLSDVAPKIINDRTYVPVRLVSNALGIGIDWDEPNRTVIVNSRESSNIEPFFDMKIVSVKPGQVITGKTELQATIPSGGYLNVWEVRYMLIDPNTAEGYVVARGNNATDKYTMLPNLRDSGEKVLVAAFYGENGKFLAGDAVAVRVDVTPQVSLTGVSEGQLINDKVSLGADVNFVASYVKYEITNLDKGTKTTTTEQDPYGVYDFVPTFEKNGNYSFKVTAYDANDNPYVSQTVNARVEVSKKLSLLGIPSNRIIDKPVTLLASRNFDVSETEYVLRDPNTGEEEIIEKIPYGGYTWFPGPDYSGFRDILVRVKDSRGVVHESPAIPVTLNGSARLLLKGIGPKQVLTGAVKLKVDSNVKLESVNYILTNSVTGAKRVIAANQDPSAEITYVPGQGDSGEWKIQAEAIYNSGKKVLSEEIPFRVYLGKIYGPQPVIEKDKFLDMASNYAKDSQAKTGMSAALQTAQAILETGWGQSVPVDKYTGQLSNNLFGIKGKGSAGSVISNTWEEYNGTTFRIDAEFRAYKEPSESWNDHKSFLLTGARYEPLRQVMYDSTQGAWALRRAGYATDSQYPIKLMRLIKQHNLLELDKVKI